ncbi:hypothetical protein ACFPRL_32775 [Pseudoclavibacter helvolus]
MRAWPLAEAKDVHGVEGASDPCRVGQPQLEDGLAVAERLDEGQQVSAVGRNVRDEQPHGLLVRGAVPGCGRGLERPESGL